MASIGSCSARSASLLKTSLLQRAVQLRRVAFEQRVGEILAGHRLQRLDRLQVVRRGARGASAGAASASRPRGATRARGGSAGRRTRRPRRARSASPATTRAARRWNRRRLDAERDDGRAVEIRFGAARRLGREAVRERADRLAQIVFPARRQERPDEARGADRSPPAPPCSRPAGWPPARARSSGSCRRRRSTAARRPSA